MNLKISSKAFSQLTHNEPSKKSAIHQAGHAVAIYIGNRQKQLPPFFFQIYIKELSSDFQLSRSLCLLNDKCTVKFDDDRLLHALPFSIEKASTDNFSEPKQVDECAFETDVINLLAGPLAEAKYVAMRDGELINPRLVNLNALHNYGGTSELEIVGKYLEYFIPEETEREKKISDLFLQAFSFINDRSNWLAITALAYYILAGRKKSIECEEVLPYLIPSCASS
ncbi:MAG: hypothetical protein WAW61_21520 [Methylococcaceae bacterium]